MSNLQGVAGEVSMTVQVTRKETGKVEEFKVIGFVNEEQLKQLQDSGALPKPQAQKND